MYWGLKEGRAQQITACDKGVECTQCQWQLAVFMFITGAHWLESASVEKPGAKAAAERPQRDQLTNLLWPTDKVQGYAGQGAQQQVGPQPEVGDDAAVRQTGRQQCVVWLQGMQHQHITTCVSVYFLSCCWSSLAA